MVMPSTGGWKVTAQTEQMQLLDSGQVGDVVVISFVTPLGNHGTVTLAKAQYQNPDLVRQTIADQVAHVDAISQMTG
jgi:hypothetical protein